MARLPAPSLPQPFLHDVKSSPFDPFRRYAPSLSSPPLASSASGLMHVLSFDPSEGEPGVPVAVRIRIQPNCLPVVRSRLVFGKHAVATTVQELPVFGPGSWQLAAIVPPSDASTSGQSIPISVQLLDVNDTVVESVIFGDFTYWVVGSLLPSLVSSPDSSPPIPTARTVKRPSPSPPPIRTLRPRLVNSLSSLPTGARDERTGPTFPPQSHIHRRPKLQSASSSDDEHTPILQILTPLEDICVDWSEDEVQRGRRLVKFHKVQHGRNLIVSCEPIPPEDYCEADTVISCISRAETGECFVTSVDIIYLLEKLTNDEFPVEEKNRIRRNLEGLHPTTISKHKRGFERFFQRIMNFPHPKPRNIEKDLKVFGWELLNQALFKILSKYVRDFLPRRYIYPLKSTYQAIVDSTPPASRSPSTVEPEPVLVHSPDSDVNYSPVAGQKAWRGGADVPYMFKPESVMPLSRSDPSESDSSLSPVFPDSPGEWSMQYEREPSLVLPKEEPFEPFTYLYEP